MEHIEIPILPVKNLVVFPFMILPINIGNPRSLTMVKNAIADKRDIGILAIREGSSNKEPGPNDLYKVGTLAKIMRMIKAPDGSTHIMVRGLARMRIIDWLNREPYLLGSVTQAPELAPDEEDTEMEAMRLNLLELFEKLVSISQQMPDELAKAAKKTQELRQLVYLICANLRLEVRDSQQLLEIDSLKEKVKRLITHISHEMEVHQLGRKIQSEAKSEMGKAQREYFLRQQLKAIQKELGEQDQAQARVDEFRNKIAECGMPEEARNEALRELSRLERLPEASSEYGVIETYLDWMTSLPWKTLTEDNFDIGHAREVLDEDHYDLVKVKERLLEYLAVRKLRKDREEERQNTEWDYLRQDREGAILCFAGPPGVGKTSLGKSVARALDRKFVRISLGGIRDEAEIRGHRRTYIGAMPGRFIQALRRVGSRNPVIMLDEVDKLSSDWRGDPSAALLEVLDPEQNHEFRDNYLDVPFDLSGVLFIATANVLDNIPTPLRDRMEVLELSGYTDEEKFNIARRYLIPRQIFENGLRQDEMTIEDECVYKVIHDYTREPGVRNLEREFATVCRKIATKVAEGREEPVNVVMDHLHEYLGKPKFNYDPAERAEIPGIATGLAVTYAGGDILFVEASRMPGKQDIKITGQLGDVMKESVQAAMSYVRAKAEDLGIPQDLFESSDVHIHIPAGATPKDGPSAGVTLVTALVSLFTGRCVRKDLGMTGEITLRGKVLGVGGIKEKVLAADRAGLKTVILPKRNEKDMDDIPDNVRERMIFHLVDSIDEVLEQALDETLIPQDEPKGGQVLAES